MDRYYIGPEDDPRAVEQPVPCMQCENAPLRKRLPVLATNAQSCGLERMVYNRCVDAACRQQLSVQGAALQLP